MNAVELHKRLENNAGLLIFGILAVSAIGGLVQVLPNVLQGPATPTANTKPYGALELVGRDIYIRESCGNCHSQQVRPLLAEVRRYGAASSAGESTYDRPFLWGSKRTGPDLHRIGGRYTDAWQRLHLLDPRAVVPKSIMPGYPWLGERPADAGDIQRKMRVLRRLGHPYTDAEIEAAPGVLAGKMEVDAVVAYLQALGRGQAEGEEDAGHGGHAP